MAQARIRMKHEIEDSKNRIGASLLAMDEMWNCSHAELIDAAKDCTDTVVGNFIKEICGFPLPPFCDPNKMRLRLVLHAILFKEFMDWFEREGII